MEIIRFVFTGRILKTFKFKAMGYTTNFVGSLKPTPKLTVKQKNTINNFKEVRHYQDGYPGIWCQWIIKDGVLVWDGSEKFYNYTEWLQYLIDNYFTEWKVLLNGQIEFQGGRIEDRGLIKVTNNIIEVIKPKYE